MSPTHSTFHKKRPLGSEAAASTRDENRHETILFVDRSHLEFAG